MNTGSAIGLGLGLAAATAGVLAALPQHRRPLVAAQVTTLVATGSYVTIALRSGQTDRIVREIAAASVGTVGAFAAAAYAPRALGPLLAAHGLYDLALERHDPAVLPTAWYPPFCAAYDVATGLAIMALVGDGEA